MARPFLPPEELKDKRICIRISAKKYKELQDLCKKEKITLSKFVKRAIYQQHKIIIF
jgi:hypothetical protein